MPSSSSKALTGTAAEEAEKADVAEEAARNRSRMNRGRCDRKGCREDVCRIVVCGWKGGTVEIWVVGKPDGRKRRMDDTSARVGERTNLYMQIG